MAVKRLYLAGIALGAATFFNANCDSEKKPDQTPIVDSHAVTPENKTDVVGRSRSHFFEIGSASEDNSSFYKIPVELGALQADVKAKIDNGIYCSAGSTPAYYAQQATAESLEAFDERDNIAELFDYVSCTNTNLRAGGKIIGRTTTCSMMIMQNNGPEKMRNGFAVNGFCAPNDRLDELAKGLNRTELDLSDLIK